MNPFLIATFAVTVAFSTSPVDAAAFTLGYHTVYDGTTIVTTPSPGFATTNSVSVPGSYTYGNTLLGPTQIIPGTPAPGYGFYDDFIFTIGGAAANSITTTIDLGSLQIQNLQERLFNASGNPTPQLGNPIGGSIDGWTSPLGTGGIVTVLPTTVLAPGTYVLQIRGSVTGADGGSYSGVFNATPVPLPAALPLFVGGFGFVAAFVRRRRKQ